MSNLSNKTRELIADNAVTKSGSHEKLAANIARLADWAERVRIHFFGTLAQAEQIQARIEQIKSEVASVAPWVEILNTNAEGVHANLNGRTVCVRFSGYFTQRDETRAGAEKISRFCPDGRIVLKEGNPLIALFDAINRERDAILEERENLRASVIAALSNIRTEKQLLAVWPEAAELLPEGERQKAGLPAIPISTLNAKIGLPTGEATRGRV